MKKLFLVLKIFLLATICEAQTFEISPDRWNSVTDTSIFDGISRAAFIVGTSDNLHINSPILSINKTDFEDIKIILAYWPGQVCRTSMLYVKFDSDTTIYKMKANYFMNTRRYIVEFNPNSDDMNINIFIEKLKTNKILYTRLSSVCLIINVDFKLNGATEALKIL